MIIDNLISHFGTQQKMALAIEVTQQTVSDWKKGRIKPSQKTAKRIEVATGGAFTRAEIRPDVFGSA